MKKFLQQLLTTKDIHLVRELIKTQSYDIAMEMKDFHHKDQISLMKCFPTEKGANITLLQRSNIIFAPTCLWIKGKSY